MAKTSASPKVHNMETGKEKVKKEPKNPLPTKKHPSLTVPSNVNQTEPKKELLRWHCCLGHIGMRWIQCMFRQGILATSEKTCHLQSSVANLTQGPLCTVCQCAKQHCKMQPGSSKKTIKQEATTLKKDKPFPGQETSLNHFLCNPLVTFCIHTERRRTMTSAKVDASWRTVPVGTHTSIYRPT